MDMNLVLLETEQDVALYSLAECITEVQAILQKLHTVGQRTDIPRLVPGAALRLQGMEQEVSGLLAQLVTLESQYATLVGGD
jgi:hypothetical protein